MGWTIPNSCRFIYWTKSVAEAKTKYDQIKQDYDKNKAVCDLVFVVLAAKDPTAYSSLPLPFP